MLLNTPRTHEIMTLQGLHPTPGIKNHVTKMQGPEKNTVFRGRHFHLHMMVMLTTQEIQETHLRLLLQSQKITGPYWCLQWWYSEYTCRARSHHHVIGKHRRTARFDHISAGTFRAPELHLPHFLYASESFEACGRLFMKGSIPWVIFWSRN